MRGPGDEPSGEGVVPLTALRVRDEPLAGDDLKEKLGADEESDGVQARDPGSPGGGPLRGVDDRVEGGQEERARAAFTRPG